MLYFLLKREADCLCSNETGNDTGFFFMSSVLSWTSTLFTWILRADEVEYFKTLSKITINCLGAVTLINMIYFNDIFVSLS